MTGAGGLLGRHLSAELARCGHRVRALDVRTISDPSDGIEAVTGDARNADIAKLACEDVDAISETAPWYLESKGIAIGG